MIEQIVIVIGIAVLFIFLFGVIYLNIEKQRKKMFKHFEDMG